MPPKPPNYIKTDKKFVNPYHFVPLPKECKRSEPPRGPLTGWIKVTLTTKSPVFIPNTSNPDAFPELRQYAEEVHGRMGGNAENRGTLKSYDFFSYETRDARQGNAPIHPVLRGSELRGMLRSAFEAVTQSCVSAVNDDQVLYRRTTIPGKPGRIERDAARNQWILRPMRKVMLKVENGPTKNDHNASFRPAINRLRLKDEDEVYIEESLVDYSGDVHLRFVNGISSTKTSKCNRKGYYHQGEEFPRRKHHESVFVDAGANVLPLDEDMVKRLYEDMRATLRLYQTGYDDLWDKIKDGDVPALDGCLVYYREFDGHYYISPAAIGREIFRNRLRDLLGDFRPCEDPDCTCPACSLFGMVGGEGALASRVRVTDALVKPKQDDLFLNPVVPAQLASPKISASEFYLQPPERNFHLWNYDYAGRWNRYSFEPAPATEYSPRLQGRKFYWHHAIETVEGHPFYDKDRKGQPPHRSPPKLDQFVGIRPLKKGKTFSFRVYFEDLKADELKLLAWVIQHGGDEQYAHKVGMGKPLGLGSVQCKIDNIFVRKLSCNLDKLEIKHSVENRTEDYTRGVEAPDHDAAKIYLRICRLAATAKELVCYPRMDGAPDETLSYQWFMANRQSVPESNGVKHIINQSLEPLDASPAESAPLLAMYKDVRAAHRAAGGGGRGGRGGRRHS